MRNGQTARLREMLWDPLALAALNQPPDQAAAPPFARVLAEMFGADPRAAAIALPTRPLHLMYAEPGAPLHRRPWQGTSSPARQPGCGSRTTAGSRCTRAATRGRRRRSLPPSRGSRFQTSSRSRRPRWPTRWRGHAMTASSPIVTVNLWFDRQVMDEPFIGLPGRAMQWVFDKRAVLGRRRSRRVALVARVQRRGRGLGAGEPRAGRHGAQRASGIAAGGPRRQADARDGRFASRAPRFRSPRDNRLGRRPMTALRGFYLAGDWIDTGLPATIESAVRSGHMAGERCIGNGVVGMIAD